jgi:flagellar basal-body rod protein FlgB
MKIDGLFNNTIEKLEKSLNLRALKHEVISSNIANADTPNYKAFELVIEEELTETENNNFSNRMFRTHPMHLSGQLETDGNASLSKRDISNEITLRGDGNTVNMEKEMAELSENHLMYRATADILAKKFQGLIKVIQGNKR